jgi:hypothetical protein
LIAPHACLGVGDKRLRQSEGSGVGLRDSSQNADDLLGMARIVPERSAGCVMQFFSFGRRPARISAKIFERPSGPSATSSLIK